MIDRKLFDFRNELGTCAKGAILETKIFYNINETWE